MNIVITIITMITGQKYYTGTEFNCIGAFLNSICDLQYIIVNDSTALRIDNIISIKGN